MNTHVKLLEIRDKATCLIVIAMCPRGIAGFDARHRWMVGRHGFSSQPGTSIILTRLDDGNGHVDPHAWGNSRTMLTAHMYIENNWDRLKSGDIIDVEFILRETKTPKSSDFYYVPEVTYP